MEGRLCKTFSKFSSLTGMDKYDNQFNTDGTKPEFTLRAGKVKKLRHSIGLLSTAATASLINKEKYNSDFVHAIWNTKLEPYGDDYLTHFMMG